MMKRFAMFGLAVAVASPLFAQGAPRGEAKATVAGKAVVVEYGRPSLKGRDMLGQAQIGRPWRMGADAATTLKTEAELKFGALTVPKGDYVLSATKVAADKWELNLAKVADKAALGSIPLVADTLADPVEAFTIELAPKGAEHEFHMKWGTTALKTSFSGK
jgi:hypothetical protein